MILGLYWDNGEENGNYYIIIAQGIMLGLYYPNNCLIILEIAQGYASAACLLGEGPSISSNVYPWFRTPSP